MSFEIRILQNHLGSNNDPLGFFRMKHYVMNKTTKQSCVGQDVANEMKSFQNFHSLFKKEPLLNNVQNKPLSFSQTVDCSGAFSPGSGY